MVCNGMPGRMGDQCDLAKRSSVQIGTVGMYVWATLLDITQRCSDREGTVWYWIQFGIGPVQCDRLDGWLVVSMDHGAVAKRCAAFWLLLQCQVH